MKHRAKIGEDAMAGSGGVAAMGREDRMKVRCRSCAARSNLRLLVNTLFRWFLFPALFPCVLKPVRPKPCTQVLELLLSQERVISLLYDRALPPRMSFGGFGGIANIVTAGECLLSY